ncbi:uncharacterized [Tachysurus ichikawai]
MEEWLGDLGAIYAQQNATVSALTLLCIESPSQACVGGAESAARRCLKSRETRCTLMTASRGAEVLQWRSEQSMLGAMLGFTPTFFS